MARWRSPRRARSVHRSGKGRARSIDRIRQLALIVIAALSACLLSPAGAAPFGHAKLAETARVRFIQPGYDAFAARLDELAENVGLLCSAPMPRRLAATRSAYRAAIVAWGRIEIITFGPVRRANRFERIFFWPDRKSIGQRQIRAVLTTQDPAAIDPARLAAKSVAIQGLTALEILLYDGAADPFTSGASGRFRCAYMKAIVGNLAAIVAAIRTEWSDEGTFATIWRTPGPDNPAYLGPRETTLELVKAFDQALETARDRRIAPAIGYGPQRRVQRAVLWRSRLTMPLVDANLRAARDLLMGSGLTDAYLAAVDRTPEAVSGVSSIASEFKLMLDATAELASEADPFAKHSIRGRLAAIGFPLKNIRSAAVARLRRAAGLSVGFNASDGD